MSAEYKTLHKAYTAWNYQQEALDLDRESEQGWQLVRGGCFSSRFVKNPQLRYRYQLDYRKVEDMGRYIETFREQGWEYINSTFNDWHYFRKIYDPSLPEEEYEIFTDVESIREMNGHWARLGTGMAVFLLVLFAAYVLFYTLRQPSFPHILLPAIILVEAAVIIRGVLMMRDPYSSKTGKLSSKLFALFLAFLILGCAASITTMALRPSFTTSQSAGSVNEPHASSDWLDFDVKYKDNYFLDLEFKSDKPLTFSIIDENGTVVYTETGTEFNKEDIKLKLPKGHYKLYLSVSSGYEIKCSLN